MATGNGNSRMIERIYKILEANGEPMVIDDILMEYRIRHGEGRNSNMDRQSDMVQKMVASRCFRRYGFKEPARKPSVVITQHPQRQAYELGMITKRAKTIFTIRPLEEIVAPYLMEGHHPIRPIHRMPHFVRKEVERRLADV